MLTICSTGFITLDKMAAIPYLVKKLLKVFFSITKNFRLSLCIHHWGLKFFQVCSNNETKLTFDLFTVCHLQIFNSCFYRVSESWSMGLLSIFIETLFSVVT